MTSETWYCWKELVTVDGETKPRLITPHSDPMEYEFPCDGLFESIEQANGWKRDYEESMDEKYNWVLVLLTMTPLSAQSIIEG